MDTVNTFVKDNTTLITNFIRTGPPNYNGWWMSKNAAGDTTRVTAMSFTIPTCTIKGIYRPVSQFVGNFFANLAWWEIDVIGDKEKIEKIKWFKVENGENMLNSENGMVME